MTEILSAENLYKIAEVELIYKSRVKASDRPKITKPEDCYPILKSLWDQNKIELLEEFKILLLNRANRILGVYEVSSGGMTGTIADPRLIFAAAIKATACQIVMAHNHPSGNLEPSRADELLTQKIKTGGALLEIKLLDHLIISKDGFYSFADMGMI